MKPKGIVPSFLQPAAAKAIVQSIALASTLLFCAASADAAQVPVDSYTYLTSPSGSYPDSGGELTDGITFSRAWGDGSPINFADVSNLVGWLNVNPSVRFDFASASFIDEIIVYAADSDGAAGVGLPTSVRITTADGYDQTFAVTNPAGAGTTVPLVFSGLGITSDDFTVTANRNNQWTMFSEVEFYNISSVIVSSPSAIALLSLGLAGLVAFRAKRAK